MVCIICAVLSIDKTKSKDRVFQNYIYLGNGRETNKR